MKFGPLLAGFGIAAGLLSFTLGSPRLATAAPDNTLGMALMSATVDNNSGNVSIRRGSGAVSASFSDNGIVHVVFDRDLSNCTCTASVGMYSLNSGYYDLSLATANCPYSSLNTVRVVTSLLGSRTNSAFHLIVFCPK